MQREDGPRESHQNAEDSDVGPGELFKPFVEMEELLDKLKLLNHEQEFVTNMKMKPLNRHYFVLQTNPGEQFYLFTALCAWLIRSTGKPFETPQEYDDPNSTIASILDVARQMGMIVDFPPNKLKQGYGEQAIFVLNHLADAALKAVQFKWKKPKYPVATDPEVIRVEDESEVLLDRIEEEMIEEAYSDEEEESVLHIDDVTNIQIGNINLAGTQKPDEILESTIRIDNWKLELERVLPQLKVTIKTDSRDWRSRLEQMVHHRKGIEDALTTTKVQLDKLHMDISQTLEKISNRERYLNTQLEPVLIDYRAVQDEFSRLSDKYREVSVGVTERSHTLAAISEELESVKQEMEERGSSMTDGTPLVHIKKAITKVKNEITNMDVRIGVLEHSLMQARLRDKSQLQQDMNAPSQTFI